MSMPIYPFVITAFVLFGIGMFGFLARRNIILMFISVEIMLNWPAASAASDSLCWCPGIWARPLGCSQGPSKA